MAKEQPQHILKAAQYAEEPPASQNHAQSFLLPVEGVNGFVLAVLTSVGRREPFEAVEGIIHNHLERLAGTVDRQTNLTHRFEQSLQALNEEVARAFDEGVFSLPIADASAIIGIADDKMVIVSGFGNLLAQFLHQGDAERYEVYDLARGMRVEEEAPSWRKPFLTVLDGEFQPGDVLYVGSKFSRHDISASTLNEVLTTLPPNSAVSKLRQYLPLSTTMACVVLKAERHDEPALKSDATAPASLAALSKTKSSTDRLLSEQKPEVKNLLLKAWSIIFPKKTAGERRKLLRRLIKFIARLGLVFVTVAGQMIVGTAISIFQMIKRLVTEPKDTLAVLRRLLHRAKANVRGLVARFNRLPRQSKYILFGIVAVILMMVGGISLINQQQARAAEAEAYAASVKAVEKKIENAEASLIYGDEEQGKLLLSEALALVKILPQDSPPRQSQAAEFQSQIKHQQDELRHAVAVELQEVTDAGMTQQVNLSQAEQVIPPSVSRPGVDVAYYGGKMYILSPESGQIYKHQKTATGFDGGAAWIISSLTSLTEATALAIDGYVWVLKADGSIIRYLSGKETDWKNATVDPPLLSATDLWTNETSTKLYVLDPNEGRVVVFDKDKGGLEVQYQNDALKGATHMVVDEIGKRILLIVNNTILSFGF